MKKCYCDYCGKECKETEYFVFPVEEKYKQYVTNGKGSKVMLLTIESKISPTQQDICEECQEKISTMLKTLRSN